MTARHWFTLSAWAGVWVACLYAVTVGTWAWLTRRWSR